MFNSIWVHFATILICCICAILLNYQNNWPFTRSTTSSLKIYVQKKLYSAKISKNAKNCTKEGKKCVKEEEKAAVKNLYRWPFSTSAPLFW